MCIRDRIRITGCAADGDHHGPGLLDPDQPLGQRGRQLGQHRVRDGTLKRSTFEAYARPLRDRINDLLRQGIHCRSRKVASMCRTILEGQHSMWTFVRHEGVEPTNNLAERTLRHAVVWRKSSQGTDSENGSRFVERMLTTVQTLRVQQRNVLDYVVAACEARLHGRPTPSLLPGSGAQQLANAA